MTLASITNHTDPLKKMNTLYKLPPPTNQIAGFDSTFHFALASFIRSQKGL
jgi:hypothetical protein